MFGGGGNGGNFTFLVKISLSSVDECIGGGGICLRFIWKCTCVCRMEGRGGRIQSLLFGSVHCAYIPKSILG